MSKGAHRTLPDTKQGIIVKAGESITYNGQVFIAVSDTVVYCVRAEAKPKRDREQGACKVRWQPSRTWYAQEVAK